MSLLHMHRSSRQTCPASDTEICHQRGQTSSLTHLQVFPSRHWKVLRCNHHVVIGGQTAPALVLLCLTPRICAFATSFRQFRDAVQTAGIRLCLSGTL